jgi:hypothetical protein
VRRGLLADENVLSGHIVQLAASTDEYVFTPQGVHIPTPVVALCDPVSHGVHAAPSDEALNPARQVHIELSAAEKVLFGHTVQLIAAADEDVFAPHGVHVPTPATFLYVPATQAVHTVPSDKA